MSERYVSAAVNAAIDTRDRAGLPSRYVRVVFPAANTPRDVVHQFNVDPTRIVRTVLRANAVIKDAPGVPWTRDVAFLQADTAGAEAWIRFDVLAEDPTYA